MKTKYSSVAIVTFMMVASIGLGILSSCSSSSSAPTLSKQDEVKAILTASPWKIKTVSVDGADKTSVYPNLGLVFANATFTSTNGGAIWPASGAWAFTSADATAFVRNDGIVVTIQEATSTSLKLALTWNKTTLGSGKTESLSGVNIFSFGK